MCNNPDSSQAGLRKCSYTSALRTVECETPGSLTTRFGVRETPHSTRGSSAFSPGEAFWNEAIIVADGLSHPIDGLSSCVAENRASKVDYGSHNSNNARNGGHLNLLNNDVEGVVDAFRAVGDGSSVGAIGIHGKDMSKEVSPLPVKHFDFRFEGKFSDNQTPADFNHIKPAISASKENALSSINPSTLRSHNDIPICPKGRINKAVSDAQGTTFTSGNSIRNEEYLNEISHNDVSNTPVREYNKVAATHEPISNFTPASSSIKDYLDLSNWLPLEICNIYNKKGISKLYPWQVCLSPLDKSG